MLKRVAASFCIVMGISIMGIWFVFYFTGSIPEIKTKPVEFGMHISAEFITAILLIISGIGLLKSINWAFDIYLLALGMLLYTLIMSPGYFAQKGDLIFVVMFALFIIITIILLTFSIRKREQFK